MKDMLKSDPKLREMIASDVIKEKATSEPNSPNVSLQTAGPSRQLTIKNPYTRSVKRALFIDSPVPAREVMKLRTAGGFTGNQTELLTSTVRSWIGRDTFEPHVREKIKDMRHVMDPFYSTTTCKLDAHNKKIREEFGRVDRVVVFNNDMLATNTFICNARKYSDISETYFRFAADHGRGFLKINGSLQSLDDAHTDKKQRFSYQDGLLDDKFKDSGVKKIILYGKSFLCTQL